MALNKSFHFFSNYNKLTLEEQIKTSKTFFNTLCVVHLLQRTKKLQNLAVERR